jgi:hypothetical protein
MQSSAPETRPQPDTSTDPLFTSIVLSFWAGIKNFFAGNKSEDKTTITNSQSK